jgi:hypothetical protein
MQIPMAATIGIFFLKSKHSLILFPQDVNLSLLIARVSVNLADSPDLTELDKTWIDYGYYIVYPSFEFHWFPVFKPFQKKTKFLTPTH